MEAMTNLGHEITTIVIAHQLSTVRHCDRIYLLEKGRVAAQARMTSWSLATSTAGA
jgi:ABC-type multidrug transport system fused ATPase/permease subunit